MSPPNAKRLLGVRAHGHFSRQATAGSAEALLEGSEGRHGVVTVVAGAIIGADGEQAFNGLKLLIDDTELLVRGQTAASPPGPSIEPLPPQNQGHGAGIP